MNLKTSQKKYLSNIGLFYAAAIWGSTFYIVKGSLSSINPVILVGYRFILAALILAVALVLNKRPLFEQLSKGIFLGIFLSILYLTQTIGLGITTASNSGFITGMFVAFVPIFSLLIFKRPPSFAGVIASAVSLSGLWFLTGGLRSANAGDILTVVAAMTYAIHLLLVDKYVNREIDPVTLCFQQFLFIGIMAFLIGLAWKLPFRPSDTGVYRVILFLALFPTLSGFVIQLTAQKFISPVRVSLIFAFEPLFAAIFAWTLGHEPFALRKAFGGLLIFAALLIASMPSPKIAALRKNSFSRTSND